MGFGAGDWQSSLTFPEWLVKTNCSSHNMKEASWTVLEIVASS